MAFLTFIYAALLLNLTGSSISKITGQNGHEDDPPSSSIAPATIPTVDPPLKTNYTVILSYSGPAVLDSMITFQARLYDRFGHYEQSKKFHYTWSNTANQSYEETWGDYQSSLYKVFPSDMIERGQYLVTVSVTGVGKHMLAFASLPFILTESLNGQLSLNQSLPYQRNASVFATGEKLQLKLNLSDKFDRLLSHEYFWYIDGEFKDYSTVPSYNMSLSKPGNHTVEVTVFVTFLDDFGVRNRTIPYEHSNSKSCSAVSMFDKCGSYVHHVHAKDPLSIVRIDGGTSVGVNSFITLNISCLGSSPTGVCWNVTKLNRKKLNETYSCVPKTFNSTNCFHRINVKPEEKGWHDVQLSVYNDVSYLNGHYFIFAYNPDKHSSPMLTVPIVFSILVCIIVIIGGVYLWKMKKKPFIEVADFEFHPSIARNESYISLSVVLSRMKKYFKKSGRTLSVQSCDPQIPSNRPDADSSETSRLIYETL
ncbi:hypothetical protein LOTGIDRAFT_237291 [Lottia gigantea]|uniref:PKD/REJ-like domain-containing protein n=1 Tax=Lottia gigantea TaxID=225164 RepID=V4BFJ7_LOTGI|nr:hypothetical protein LOTGIDRAFT_237291 [Lottia gigantea]ESP04647.1 hypothetical protein LOTGIDRAFT_237291 [Lottia gigantea]